MSSASPTASRPKRGRCDSLRARWRSIPCRPAASQPVSTRVLSTDRPQAREWIEPLDALAKALKKCELHNGHYYYRELRDCPWCGIESQARVRLFNFLLPEDGSRRGHFRLDEIWKDIVSVEAPSAPPLVQWDKRIDAPDAVGGSRSPLRETGATASFLRSYFRLSSGWRYLYSQIFRAPSCLLIWRDWPLSPLAKWSGLRTCSCYFNGDSRLTTAIYLRRSKPAGCGGRSGATASRAAQPRSGERAMGLQAR